MYHPDSISEVKRNQPIFNRCIILIQQIKAYGHPEPLCVPKELYRKSIAVYYYTKNENEVIEF